MGGAGRGEGGKYGVEIVGVWWIDGCMGECLSRAKYSHHAKREHTSHWSEGLNVFWNSFNFLEFCILTDSPDSLFECLEC